HPHLPRSFLVPLLLSISPGETARRFHVSTSEEQPGLVREPLSRSGRLVRVDRPFEHPSPPRARDQPRDPKRARRERNPSLHHALPARSSSALSAELETRSGRQRRKNHFPRGRRLPSHLDR